MRTVLESSICISLVYLMAAPVSPQIQQARGIRCAP